MTATIHKFPTFRPSPELQRDLANLAEASNRWDRMAEALGRRDYAEFDRIKAEAPGSAA